MPITITQENVDAEVFKSLVPVVIDVYAVWCGPCQFMTPIVEELEKELGSQYKFGTINVDESRDLSIKFGVTSVPTFIFVKNGVIQGKVTGQMSKEELQESIIELLG
jgi:thioredoxin 1